MPENEDVLDQLGSGQIQAAPQLFPPGHFYSPVPDLRDLEERTQRIFGPPPHRLPGIDLREEQQLELLGELAKNYEAVPFPSKPQPNFRYYFDNPFYSYSDAICSHLILRHFKPARIIEVGSGNSSALLLDTAEGFLGGGTDFTFIDPFPTQIKRLLKDAELPRSKIIASAVQNISPELFLGLNKNDVLFIDSTHVSKPGSDVNHLFFEILPALRPGVLVHFHDVFYPFEYPKSWIWEGRQWNEQYLLRTFLQFNKSYEITLFNSFLHLFHADIFAKKLPLCLKDQGGSIWIQKVC